MENNDAWMKEVWPHTLFLFAVLCCSVFFFFSLGQRGNSALLGRLDKFSVFPLLNSQVHSFWPKWPSKIITGRLRP